jgi:glycosyltransferase involved in cell wall biosynthesis
MMTDLGHEVYLYAGEENEARVKESVPVVSKVQQKKWFGHYDWERDVFDGWDNTSEHWWQMNVAAIAEISKRSRAGDFVCLISGWCQQMLADLGYLTVEWGVGYKGILPNTYRCFESYAWMHHLAAKAESDDIRYFDTVIPNSFDVSEFPAGSGDGDFAFLGRLIRRKGPHIAAEVCKILGERLILAGQGVAEGSPHSGSIMGKDGVVVDGHVTHIGRVNIERRARLLGRAKALFVPTIYLEPFGGVAVEAMLCFPGEVEIEAKEVHRKFQNIFTGDLICVDSDHHSIRCTPDHPFATQRGWVRAGDLTKYDYLLANRRCQTGEILRGRIGDIVEGLSVIGSNIGGPYAESNTHCNSRKGSKNGPTQNMGGQNRHVSSYAIREADWVYCRPNRRGGHRHLEAIRPRYFKEGEGSSVCRDLQYLSEHDEMVASSTTNPEYSSARATHGTRVRGNVYSGRLLVPANTRVGLRRVIQGHPAIPYSEATADGNGRGIHTDHFGVKENGIVDRTSACFIEDDSVYELTPIKNISRREVSNLPVFNLGTRSGTYQANGFLTHNCGTPVITTDHGAFTEYVIDGFNGFRCRTLAEFVRAAQTAPHLPRADIRKWAQNRFSTEVTAPKYEAWFRKLETLRREGWYELA